MKKNDKLSLLITFVAGFLAGGYLYLTDFALIVTDVSLPDVEEVSEFSIASDVYGGCRSACPSFRIESDGNYRYLYTPGIGMDQVLREGNLPFQIKRRLHAELNKAALTAQSKEITPSVCNSYSDGIDVKYEVTLDGEVFTLNTCGTAVETESALWQSLGAVWDYYETLGKK